jgi:hypothetical protein
MLHALSTREVHSVISRQVQPEDSQTASRFSMPKAYVNDVDMPLVVASSDLELHIKDEGMLSLAAGSRSTYYYFYSSTC